MKVLSIYVLVCLGSLIGCSSAQVVIDTTPEKSEVFIKPLGSEKFTTLGVAPIKTNTEELEKKTNSSGPYYIEARKADFTTKSVLLTQILASTDIKLSITLDGQAADSDNSLYTGKIPLNELIDELFAVQKLAQTKKYAEALEKLESLQKRDPKLSVLHELKGGIFFLEKKWNESFRSYSMAKQYNPNNPDIEQMLERVKMKIKEGRGRDEG